MLQVIDTILMDMCNLKAAKSNSAERRSFARSCIWEGVSCLYPTLLRTSKSSAGMSSLALVGALSAWVCFCVAAGVAVGVAANVAVGVAAGVAVDVVASVGVSLSLERVACFSASSACTAVFLEAAGVAGFFATDWGTEGVERVEALMGGAFGFLPAFFSYISC
jgi:hypothetical protein